MPNMYGTSRNSSSQKPKSSSNQLSVTRNDPKDDIHKHLIYTTMTYNSFTLYTFENSQLLEKLLPNGRTINCFEIINSQLSAINDPSSFTMGIIPVSSISNLPSSTRSAVQNNSLTLYYIKYKFNNSDDLVTLLTICSSRLKKEFPFIILDHILANYKEFRENKTQQAQQNSSLGVIAGKSTTGNPSNNHNIFGDYDFKPEFANIIITEEKKIHSLPSQLVLRSAVSNNTSGTSPSETSPLLANNQGTSSDLFGMDSKDVNDNSNADLSNLNITFMTSELNELKQIMNDNVDKLMERHDRLGSLVNKTDKINLNSRTFKRRTLQLKRRLWWGNVKMRVILAGIIIFILYIIGGEVGCGLPFYGKCLKHEKNKKN
ncbi:Nyv1 protein [Saccharomycopsis crataegensis]|uniref:Nyv1 protein n=1 Tax=Saccharomycopsis crataegensis TaxID=43959 RepID=A0AAV5QQM2_9ASCO|nr:Nyv1 protein [Saccharomycopsis crataegensis]